MVAFHFPPFAGSSGVQRTLRFVQQLPPLGWAPIVLTAHPRAYEQTSHDLLRDVPDDVPVSHAFAVDAARHLTVAGRYPGWLARPDRWMNWKFDAVRRGLHLIRRHRPDVLWSTYPLATAHVIGHALHRLSGIPWVADFRDPMAQDGYPAEPSTWRAYKKIEASAMRRASCCVFTTPGAARAYRDRYADAAARVEVIENGYDEESFAGLAPRPQLREGPCVVLHSGVVYPSERDPTALFAALAALKQVSGVTAKQLLVRFRAPVHEDMIRRLAQQYAVQDLIEIRPSLPYRDALAEMGSVGALLVLQAQNCNEQIPAKAYEYLRAGRPIVGLTDAAGDTAGLLRSAGVPYLASLRDGHAIAAVLARLRADWLAAREVLPRPESVAAASREARARQLAALLTSIKLARTGAQVRRGSR
jgi:glycosyltransferase involved in cell wall biosynthesis